MEREAWSDYAYSLHSPENNHVASVPRHSNTRPAHPKAAIRIPSSAGPTHPMVSVPLVYDRVQVARPLRVGVVGAAVGLVAYTALTTFLALLAAGMRV